MGTIKNLLPLFYNTQLTPLIIASSYIPLSREMEKDKLAKVKILREHGAEINAATTSGQTALSSAAEAGFSQIVAYLIQSGAKARKEDRINFSLFAKTCEKNNTDKVKNLIEEGVNINATTDWVRTWDHDQQESTLTTIQSMKKAGKIIARGRSTGCSR